MSENMQLYREDDKTSFDYSSVDSETAEFLKQKETQIKDVVVKSATELGKYLKEAQERLAQYRYGCFLEWVESIGLKKDTVYKLIRRFELIFDNIESENILEALPLSLSYEVSKPSAPAVLVEKVLEGDITTHAEYKRLEAELRHEIEKAKTFAQRLDERDEQLRSKDNMIKNLMSRPAEVKEIPIENPETERALLQKQNEIQQLRYKHSQMERELSELKKDSEKLAKIQNADEYIYQQEQKVSKLKRASQEYANEYKQMTEVSELIVSAKKFFQDKMIPVAMVNNISEDYMKHYRKELATVFEFYDNWKLHVKQIFRMQ